ncbi:CHC2 zinc finger domain-containing protein [Teredinibacter haidensis]|uniref:CHC2 zinc finger domain-containing protein n=1 Tax=Teredinibacter haidensis TaxID=2731755 RepID=UPI0009490B29|nr:CHC2 zinc finger domain-containing protein [Teredinibacter haidensis]
MARIPDDTINQIKADVSLLDLVRQQGFEVVSQGKDSVVSCPFHEEKTPSCIISPKTNLFNCFGCGAGGSVIDWVMRTERLDFRQAALRLQQQYLPLAASSESKTNAHTPEPVDVEVAPTEDDQAVLQQVISFYHETLKQNQDAQDHLKYRGLDDAELINHFKLGYANRSLGITLPAKQVKAGAQIREQLQRIGLYRETGREHFNGSLVIPVIDENGVVTEVYGRKTVRNLRKGTPKHLYLPGPHSGVFNPEGLNSDEVILCESLIDALTFWRWGFKHVTTSYGTQGFTDELFDRITALKIKRVLIAYDRDEAGNAAAEKAAKQLIQAGIACYRILFPKGMDANEYARQVTPAQKSLGLVIRKAEWMGGGEPPLNDIEEIETPSPLAASSLVAPTHPASATLEHPCSSDAVKPELAEPTENSEQNHSALPEPPTSSPVPKHDPLTVDAQIKDNEMTLAFGPRHYRVRGLNKSVSYDSLKVNVLVRQGEHFHVDSLDLYVARQRQSFIKQAIIELGVDESTIKNDLGKVLLALESHQQDRLEESAPKDNAVYLNDEEQEAALSLLRDPNLLDRILADFNAAGVVGEETNKLVGYLAAVSRKLDNPLAVVIQSTSAAGKSSLMNAVLAMMPKEECVQYSAMTGQSLFYMGETNLKHKILALAEEEGAESASYALKLLQSEGELTIASTGKDADGNLMTQEYRVEGPVMLFTTTTAIDIDEELMNRCIVLTVNESREQTRLIHELQRDRETLDGMLADETKKAILQTHSNAQRLLKSIKVVNPFAKQLTFMDSQTRSRRDHMKYLHLIKTVALLHQYQREIKTVLHQGKTLEYIEVELSDIAIANRLAHDVLGRSLDELPPQTRKLLSAVHDMVKAVCHQDNIKQNSYHFSRKTVREKTGWGDTQLKIHLSRLVELEYLMVHKQGQKYLYELQYHGEGESGQAFLMNLIDVESLKKISYDNNRSGLKASQSECGRPVVGGQSGDGREAENQNNSIKPDSNTIDLKNPESNSTQGKINHSVSSHRTQSTRCAHGAGSSHGSPSLAASVRG